MTILVIWRKKMHAQTWNVIKTRIRVWNNGDAFIQHLVEPGKHRAIHRWIDPQKRKLINLLWLTDLGNVPTSQLTSRNYRSSIMAYLDLMFWFYICLLEVKANFIEINLGFLVREIEFPVTSNFLGGYPKKFTCCL